jgi:hypothetical protein
MQVARSATQAVTRAAPGGRVAQRVARAQSWRIPLGASAPEGRKCGLTPRSRRGPTALHLAREAPWSIMRLAGQAPYRRSRLTSNVRRRKHTIRHVPAPRRCSSTCTPRCRCLRARRSAGNRCWQRPHSGMGEPSSLPLGASGCYRLRCASVLAWRYMPAHHPEELAPRTSRSSYLRSRIHRALGVRYPLLPSAELGVRSCLLGLRHCSGCRMVAVATEAQNATSLCQRRRLTPRSRRGPTALHLAREPPWYMMRLAGQAQCRRSRLNSNVRRCKDNRATRVPREQPKQPLPETRSKPASTCGSPAFARPRSPDERPTQLHRFSAFAKKSRAGRVVQACRNRTMSLLGERTRVQASGRLLALPSSPRVAPRRERVRESASRSAVQVHRASSARTAVVYASRPHRAWSMRYPRKQRLTARSRRGPTALHLAREAPVVDDEPRGQGAIPSVPPHLER